MKTPLSFLFCYKLVRRSASSTLLFTDACTISIPSNDSALLRIGVKFDNHESSEVYVIPYHRTGADFKGNVVDRNDNMKSRLIVFDFDHQSNNTKQIESRGTREDTVPKWTVDHFRSSYKSDVFPDMTIEEVQ